MSKTKKRTATKEKLSTSVLVLSLSCLSFASHAYDQKECMQGIDQASKSLYLVDDASNKMLSTMMGLLNSGVGEDDARVTHLTNAVQLASIGLTSAQVVSTLRQYGSFKQPALVDGIVNIELQGAFTKFVVAQRSFVRFTGSLRNSTLREQAFMASQELEKIITTIRACQK